MTSLLTSMPRLAGTPVRSVPFRQCRLPFRPLSIRVSAQRQPEEQQEQPSAALLAAALVTPWLLGAGAAQAVDGEFGILEGRTAALVSHSTLATLHDLIHWVHTWAIAQLMFPSLQIHPALTAFLFGASLYAGYLGLQWRRIRELGGKVKELKDQLPKPDAEGNRPSSPLESEVKALEQVGWPTSNLREVVWSLEMA